MGKLVLKTRTAHPTLLVVVFISRSYAKMNSRWISRTVFIDFCNSVGENMDKKKDNGWTFHREIERKLMQSVRYMYSKVKIYTEIVSPPPLPPLQPFVCNMWKIDMKWHSQLYMLQYYSQRWAGIPSHSFLRIAWECVCSICTNL